MVDNVSYELFTIKNISYFCDNLSAIEKLGHLLEGSHETVLNNIKAENIAKAHNFKIGNLI
jgi:hypothetical protein